MKLTIKIRSHPEKLQELYQTLQALLPTIRKGKGCRMCNIYKDTEDGEVFFLAGDWQKQTNLENYLRSESGGALLGVIDLLGKAAEATIDNEELSNGIETLKRMRREKGGE
jgi:quinol monooxygenase YgiN